MQFNNAQLMAIFATVHINSCRVWTLFCKELYHVSSTDLQKRCGRYFFCHCTTWYHY